MPHPSRRAGDIERRPVERIPVFKRVPVTKEFVATYIGSGNRDHLADDIFSLALYNSIDAMVYKLARKYSITCDGEIDDLAHSCIERIFTTIHQYDQGVARFNTWAWHVCESVLNRQYRASERRRTRLVYDEDVEDKAVTPAPSPLRMEITDTIVMLFRSHPEQCLLLSKMFGDPADKDFTLPDRVVVSQAAAAAGVEYRQAYAFYHDVVKPVFKERFDYEEEGGSEDE